MPALTDYFHDGDEKLNRKGHKALVQAKEKDDKAKQITLEQKQREYLSPENDDLWEEF